jgi:hypothetical protein
MPSPDFSQYIDLTINDKQPDDIYNEAVEYARLALPEFAPRAGTVEDAVIQANSYISAITLANINRLPDGLMEGVLKYMGIIRKEATFGSVTLDIELAENGLSVPSGTVVVYETTDGDVLVQYPFETVGIATAASNSSSVSVTATSQVSGIIPNIPSGTELTLGQPSNEIISVTTSSLVTQGARAETEVEYFNRGTTQLESLSSTLTTARQVERFILSQYPEVHRCKVYDLTRAYVYEPADSATNGNKDGFNATVSTSSDFISLSNEINSDSFLVISPDYYGTSSFANTMPTGLYSGASAGSSSIQYTDVVSSSGSYGPIKVVSMNSLETGRQGDSPGYFVIVACDSVGNPIPDSTKETMYEEIADRVTAGLTFEILDAYPVDINMTVTISVTPEFNETTVAQNVSDELESYLSLPNWPDWNTVVRIFDIVVRASRVEGVDYVFSVSPSIPSYTSGSVRAGNQNLVSTLNDGVNLIGYTILHIGVLPRANVEVVVI